MDQKRAYCADSSKVERRASFWIDSTKSVVWSGREEVVEAKGWVYAGKRARESEKVGEGNTVRAFARMLVVVSVLRRCGLNW